MRTRLLPFLLFSLLTLLVSLPARGDENGISYSLTGSTYSRAVGKEETKDGLVLHSTVCGDVEKVHLDDYGMLGYNNIGISGTLTLDKDGNIVKYEDLVVTGMNGVKMKTITGVLTRSHADITLDGKVAGIFNFHINFKAGK